MNITYRSNYFSSSRWKDCVNEVGNFTVWPPFVDWALNTTHSSLNVLMINLIAKESVHGGFRARFRPIFVVAIPYLASFWPHKDRDKTASDRLRRNDVTAIWAAHSVQYEPGTGNNKIVNVKNLHISFQIVTLTFLCENLFIFNHVTASPDCFVC